MGVKLPDNVWQVVKDHYAITDDLRSVVEKESEIVPFDGGAFLAVGNEFDLFVVPEKRGRWRIRSEVTKYLTDMGKRHDKIVVRISEHNTKSLRLARHFGFNEVGRDNGVIRLENSSWVAH